MSFNNFIYIFLLNDNFTQEVVCLSLTFIFKLFIDMSISKNVLLKLSELNQTGTKNVIGTCPQCEHLKLGHCFLMLRITDFLAKIKNGGQKINKKAASHVLQHIMFKTEKKTT